MFGSHLLKLDMFWWVVGFTVLISRFMFGGTCFSTSRNECQAATKTRHVSMSICSKMPIAHTWELTPGCLEAMHLQLVAEILSRGMCRRQCHTNLFLSLTQVNCYGSKALRPKTWGQLLVHTVQCLIASALKLYVNSPSVSPPIFSFSGICKVMKFY